MKVRILLGCALAALASSAARAAVVNFDDNSDGVYWTSPIYSDGFTATSDQDEDGSNPLGTNYAVDGSGVSDGTVHLDAWTNDSSDTVWTLTQTDGGAFNLSSFDFGSGYSDGSDTVSSVTLTGLTSLGDTVSQVITPLDQDFHTYAVNSDFSSLTSVTFDASGLDNRAAYDNINVGGGAPEPGTWALMLIGIGGLGAGLRANRKVRAVCATA